MVVPISFSEGGRNKLAIIASCICSLLTMTGLCVIGIGVFIKYRISDELILLESYNSDVLPLFLVSVGTLLIVINGVSIKIIYDSGFASTSEKFRMVLLPLAILMFLFTWVILAAGIVTLEHRSDVEDALHDGLKDAMRRYKDNIAIKAELDRVQMRNRCCGSVSYKDWFNTAWINTNYVNTNDFNVASKMIDGKLYDENVPFSCCDVTVRRPCVTHDVLDKTKHLNYDSVTLYRKGCTAVLMDEYENVILHPTGSCIMVLFGIQFAVFILVRYLQTSLHSAIEEGDPEGPGKGSLLPGQLCGSCSAGDPGKYQQEALGSIRGAGKGVEPDSEDESPTAPLNGAGYSSSPGYMPDMEAANDINWTDGGGLHRGEERAMSQRESSSATKQNRQHQDQHQQHQHSQQQQHQQQQHHHQHPQQQQQHQQQQHHHQHPQQQQHQQHHQQQQHHHQHPQQQKQQQQQHQHQEKQHHKEEKRSSSQSKKEKSKSTKQSKSSKKSKSPEKSKSPSTRSKSPKPSKRSKSPKPSKRSKSPKPSKRSKSPKPSKRSKSPKPSKRSKSTKSSKKSKSMKR